MWAYGKPKKMLAYYSRPARKKSHFLWSTNHLGQTSPYRRPSDMGIVTDGEETSFSTSAEHSVLRFVPGKTVGQC